MCNYLQRIMFPYGYMIFLCIKNSDKERSGWMGLKLNTHPLFEIKNLLVSCNSILYNFC